MILGRLLQPVSYELGGVMRVLTPQTVVEIISIGQITVTINSGGVLNNVRADSIEILVFEEYYKFTRELLTQHHNNLITHGNYISVNRYFSTATSSVTLTLERYNLIRSVRSVNLKNYPFNDAPAGKDEKAGSILSNNLKLLFGEDFKITVDNLLKIFKYIPVRYQGNSGFYDSKNKRLVLFNFIRLKSPNPYKPGKIITEVQFIPIKDEESSIILQMLDVKSLKNCKFIVRNYIDSGRIFKFTNEKKEVLNKEFEALEISLGVKSKNSEEPVNTIILRLPNGNRRFILSDIEIVYPNINGYNEKKDRVIKPNMNVKVIDDKHTIFKKNDVVKAVGVKNLGTKKFAIFLDKNNNEKLYNINKFKVI